MRHVFFIITIRPLKKMLHRVLRGISLTYLTLEIFITIINTNLSQAYAHFVRFNASKERSEFSVTC